MVFRQNPLHLRNNYLDHWHSFIMCAAFSVPAGEVSRDSCQQCFPRSCKLWLGFPASFCHPELFNSAVPARLGSQAASTTGDMELDRAEVSYWAKQLCAIKIDHAFLIHHGRVHFLPVFLHEHHKCFQVCLSRSAVPKILLDPVRSLGWFCLLIRSIWNQGHLRMTVKQPHPGPRTSGSRPA